MKAIRIMNVFTLLIFSAGVHCQTIWESSHLARVKSQLDAPAYRMAYENLIAMANDDIRQRPLSVMVKSVTPPSGDKHDYMSLARYAWPDPSQPNGLPYIMKDGQSNPELAQYDRQRLGQMADMVSRLSLAYYFSNDEKFAQKATEMIRVWFLNKSTRMNPNMKYAQCVPGVAEGRSYGVLDTYSFVTMLDGVQLLSTSKSFTKKDERQLKSWFKEYVKWLTTSSLSLEERAAENNHGTAYDAQLAAFARYIGDEGLFHQILSQFPSKRILSQIEKDGSQPQELRRTLAFGYSEYNISHILDLMFMAKNAGLDVEKYVSVDGHSIYQALNFLMPYMGKDVSAWPWQQISEWDEKQQALAEDFYRAWILNPKQQDYLNIYRRHKIRDWSSIFVLLYEEPTKIDNAMAEAESQLSYALKCVDKAKKDDKSNACIPVTLKKDGSLQLGAPRDWRSGFFAGTLWQLYNYNHAQSWREDAVSNTWLIESIKDYKGTHDLGFMINDSFGKAWDLTGEKSYRDVIVRAAKSLITRFNPTIGCIRSWDHNGDKWKFPVIIDNMMNLELLFDATRLTGDSTYYQIAVTHANTTMKNHFRPDYSTFHVVDYDPSTGKVRQRVTAQGYSNDSYWSRGQAWGLYGYTLCYRYTHDKRYLKQAMNIFNFLSSLKNMPEDGIFYWDMKDPKIPNVPRDASAAAIAASALYELCLYANSSDSANYKQYADKIVNSLIDNYQAKVGTAEGFLLLHSTGNLPSNSEIDVPLNYADYYYLEAMSRKMSLEQ